MGAGIYLGLFIALWLSEGLAVATFAALVLFAFGLAVRIVTGFCGILDHAREGEFARREAVTTALASGVLAATVFAADLPMVTISKAAAAIGIIVYFVAKYVFRT